MPRGVSTNDETVWNEFNTAKLRTLWADLTLSTAEIGRRMKVSKNAVVGKAHRIGLPGRPSPIHRDAPPRPARVPSSLKRTLPDLAAPPEPPTKAAAPRVPTPRRRAAEAAVVAPAAPLARRPCQWPLNDRRPWRFCGCDVVVGRPFCAEHCRVAYVRSARQEVVA